MLSAVPIGCNSALTRAATPSPHCPVRWGPRGRLLLAPERAPRADGEPGPLGIPAVSTQRHGTQTESPELPAAPQEAAAPEEEIYSPRDNFSARRPNRTPPEKLISIRTASFPADQSARRFSCRRLLVKQNQVLTHQRDVNHSTQDGICSKVSSSPSRSGIHFFFKILAKSYLLFHQELLNQVINEVKQN